MDLKSHTCLIDAYNLLFFLYPHPKDLEKARESLLHFLHDLKINCHLVFDGANDELEIQTKKKIKIFYTSRDQKADGFILYLIKNSQNPELLITISSDNEVVRRAKLYGSKVLTVQEFIEKTLKRNTVVFSEKEFEETEENILRYQKIFEKRFLEQIKKSQKN